MAKFRTACPLSTCRLNKTWKSRKAARDDLIKHVKYVHKMSWNASTEFVDNHSDHIYEEGEATAAPVNNEAGDGMAVDEGKAFAIEQCEGLLRQITDAETVFDTTLAVNEKASNIIRGGLLNVAQLMANVNLLKSTLENES